MLNSKCFLVFLAAAAVVAGCKVESSDDDPDAGVAGSGGSDAGTDAVADSSPEAGVVAACSNIEALRPTCQALPESFAASTTLAKGCYLAGKSPTLAAGVTLTLSPGVTILFAEGTRLQVDGDRTLVAAGTTQDPICLSGDKAEKGSWLGLEFGHNDTASKLEHVTIEYAGSTKSDSINASVKALADSSGVTLQLSNTTIRESEGYGLRIGGSTALPSFSGNTFTKNKLGPVYTDSEAAGLLDASSDYTGNDVDEITVQSQSLSKNASWKSLGVPYHLIGAFGMNVTVPWTLEAPNTVIMPAEVSIDLVGDGAALTAIGTADKPIVFTAETKERGFWQGLVFDNTMNPANKLDFVTVEYAGRTDSIADNGAVRAIADSHGVTLSITNTTLHESEGYGLFLTGSAVLPAFANNTFTKNTLGPVNVGSEAVHQLEVSSKYTGNDIDRIRVRDGYVSKSVTWANLGVPYQLEDNIHVMKVWSLDPGVTLLMAQSTWISVDGDEAGFHAVGTAANPITISGVEKTAGYWHAIAFGNSNNASNVLQYVTVEYGGSTTGGGEEGMINAAADSHGVSLTVDHCIVKDSAQWGIWLCKNAQVNGDIDTANTFSGNAKGDVFREQ